MSKKIQILEPTIEIKIKLGDTVTTNKIKKLSNRSIQKITKKYDAKTDELDALQKVQELKDDLVFLVKEANSTDIVATRVRALAKEVKSVKAEIKKIEQAAQEEKEKLEIEYNKELCLSTVIDAKAEKFFKEIAEEYSWQELSDLIALQYQEYEKTFLKD